MIRATLTKPCPHDTVIMRWQDGEYVSACIWCSEVIRVYPNPLEREETDGEE
jgi:hypothetical protein